MSLQDHVVSLELAKQLKEAGYPQDTYFWWRPMQYYEKPEWELLDWHDGSPNEVAAPLASELGELLPEVLMGGFLSITTKVTGGVHRSWGIRWINSRGVTTYEAVKESRLPTNTLANAMAKTWLKLKSERGIL